MQTVKQKILWFWQNAERILIIVFFATFTFNIRKVFLTPYSYLNGGFNEYMTMSFSWADVLMIAVILIYATKWLFSQLISFTSAKFLLFNVIRYKSSVIRNYYNKNVSRETSIFLLFLGWAGFSIFWSQFWPISLYRFLILIEISLFTIIAIKTLKNTKWLKMAFFALILNGLFQSLVGIAQFIHNGSLGLNFLGESIFGPNVDGVAKIIINGEKHIRAYGTLPHPNILAGFLIISLFLLLAEYIFRFKKVSYETFLNFIPRWFLFTAIWIISLGFILTFSRSVFLGFLTGLFVFFILISNLQSKYKHKKKKLYLDIKFTAITILIIISVGIFLFDKTSFFSKQSFNERNLYQDVSYETISNYPIMGVGLGQFVLNEYREYPILESWQYQPVHNIFLLIFSELGIIGFILFFLFIASLFKFRKMKFREDNNQDKSLTYLLYYCIIFSFLIISFFDHYFWDIKIGITVFALPILLKKIAILLMK
jgi:O-antigen ligase